MPVRLGWIAASVTIGLVVSLGAPAIASTPLNDPVETPVEEIVQPPNVLLIVTDDQRAGTEVAMPTVMSELAGQGTTYTQAFVPTSWCCPSRASLLTGKFAHNTGVWQNNSTSAWGGWPAFAHGGEESDTLATRLQDAGYKTGLFGKYLNRTEIGRTGPPPGWDTWSAFLSGNHMRYRLATDSTRITGDRQYLTDELADQAVDFIESTSPDQPFFTYFAPYAPHSPFDAGPYAGMTRAEGRLEAMRQAARYPSPSTNQADMTGYPEWMQRIEPNDTWEVTERRTGSSMPIDEVVERQADMLRGIDVAIGRMIESLRTSGRLDNTLIVFMSDNGFAWGEHRLQGKNTPYDVSVRVPLIMRFDESIPAGAADPRIVAANVDVHATILDITGVAPGEIDGLSALTSSRDGLVMEAMSWGARWGRPAYCGFRTRDYLYVRYASGEEELYDYAADPYELTNLAGRSVYGAVKSRLEARARQECDPTPPGFTWDGLAPRLSAPTDVGLKPIGQSGLIVTWRAPANIGARMPSYEVYIKPAAGRRPVCVLRSSGLTQGLRCRVETPGKRRTTEVTVVAIRGDERAASFPLSLEDSLGR